MDTGFQSLKNTFVRLAKGAFYGIIWDEGKLRPLTLVIRKKDSSHQGSGILNSPSSAGIPQHVFLGKNPGKNFSQGIICFCGFIPEDDRVSILYGKNGEFVLFENFWTGIVRIKFSKEPWFPASRHFDRIRSDRDKTLALDFR